MQRHDNTLKIIQNKLKFIRVSKTAFESCWRWSETVGIRTGHAAIVRGYMCYVYMDIGVKWSKEEGCVTHTTSSKPMKTDINESLV